MIIQPTDFTPLVHKTRELLCETFHCDFFYRYTDHDEIATNSYLFEMALFLHTRYKLFDNKIGPIVRMCNAQRGVSSPNDVARQVEFAIRDHVKQALKLLAPASTSAQPSCHVLPELSGDLSMYEDDLPSARSAQHQHDELVNEELRRWKNDTSSLRESSPGSQRAESVLKFWSRNSSRYQLLSQLVRMVFAVPSSSAQIERGFSLSGNTTTPKWSSISAANLDMTAFLKGNADIVDVAQCAKIPATEAALHLPIAFMAALGIGIFRGNK
ncbi:hypothetical protein P43SY_000186 [Pythium insidiosum]|uniref:HAT C-terminal dimerisation domain-containing protein n=1 Tax=Pythium insidiosum TaxID=114742 RepID=A0AAD5M825_PYTIN|nr:hypothetical protein P43SY_000186 [Pythium insidiosum]